MIWWLLSVALAEAPSTIPKGSKVLYSGVGLSTFSRLDQGAGTQTRDRAVKPRLDLYGSWGAAEWLQLSLSAPLQMGVVLDDPDLLPCPNLLSEEDYCSTWAGVGTARLDARTPILKNTFKLTGGLAAMADPWNRGTRGRYNAPGPGTASAEAFVVAGPVLPVGDWTVRILGVGAYAYSFAPKATSADGTVTVKAPGDQVRGSAELRVKPPAPVAVETGVHLMQRLSGVPLSGDWGTQWFPETKDRWNVLQTRLVMGSAKVSFDLPSSMGIHVGGTWSYAVSGGPSDLFDVSVGWHKYFAPKG